jgi:hypothetical protein
MPPRHAAEASERILKLLSGSTAQQRAEGFDTLAQVVRGTAPCTLPQPGATIRVLGLGQGAGAADVLALLEPFGEVTACTLCNQQRRRRAAAAGVGQTGASSALVTFGCAADAQKATAAEHLSVRCEGTEMAWAGSTGTQGDALLRHRAEVIQSNAVNVLLPVVAPMMEILSVDDESEGVSLEEFQRGSLVLASMVTVDILAIGGEICKDGRPFTLGVRGHFARVFHKSAQDLTANDALTAACWTSAMGLAHCNLMGCIRRSGMDELSFLGAYGQAVYNTPEYKADIDRSVRLAQLLMDLILSPDDVSAHAAIGGCIVLVHLYFHRASDGSGPATAAVDAGFVHNAVEAVRDYSAHERIGLFNLGGARMWCLKDAVSSAPPEDAIRMVIETGLIDIILENLGAIRALNDVSQVCVMHYWYGCFYLLSSLELHLPSAAPVVQKLRAAAGDIQWCIEHSVTHMELLGWSVSAQGTLLAAAAFGRDEENEGLFTFTQNNITEVVRYMRDILRPKVPVWPMKASFGLELLDLIIPDRNKRLLLSTENFIEHLLDGLLLDPEHPQITDPNTDWEAVKAPVQSTHISCLQQLALYGPGRDALRARQDVMDALVSVAADGWSRAAMIAAHGAVKALSDVVPRPLDGGNQSLLGEEGSDSGGGHGHVMLSYQWDHQRMVKRINGSLRRRGYTTWLDLADMRGSTVDAMSDAVDCAAVVLVGVARSYKGAPPRVPLR